MLKVKKSYANSNKPQYHSELERLSHGVEDAFNLCCPKEGCHAVLDKVEGCNAAVCSNEVCKSTFCYLCLKETEKSFSARHDHVKEHSGGYWERRPGFTERYHWLIARKKLDYLLSPTTGSIDSAVRTQVLESSIALLQDNKMWPMPAGSSISQWIAELEHAKFPKGKKWYQRIWPWKQNDKQQKIELLQNEYIYRQQEGDKQNAEVVAAELTRLGGQILASLDIKDALAATGEGGRADPIPVDDHDARVTPEFAALGNMYEMANLIWSGVPARKMPWKEAVGFCKTLGKGSRLPTWSEYYNLTIAMGRPHRYDANLLPDMKKNLFWSSKLLPGQKYFAACLNGDNGDASFQSKTLLGSVRCVRKANL